MIKSKTKKVFLAGISLLLLTLLTYHRWLTFDILSQGDYIYYFHESLQPFIYPSVWIGVHGLGFVNILAWRYPIEVILGLFGTWGFDYNVADRFVTLWPWMILSWSSIFLLIYYEIRSEISAFIGSLVFCFNTYYLIINSQGQLLISIAGSFAILSLFFFMRTLETKKAWYGLLTSVMLFLSASYDFRILYVILGVLFLYFIYFFFFLKKIIFKAFISTSLLASVSIIIFILLSLYWIVSLSHTTSLTGNIVLSRTLFGNELLNLLYAITLHHPFWNGSEPEWFMIQPISFQFWFIPLFAIFGLYLNRKNKNALFFGLIALVGIFLTKQVALPFSFIYPFLFQHFPGFSAFREASKFYFLVSLSYSVLIAFFVDWLWKNSRITIFGQNIKYIITALIALLFIWNIKPLATGEIGSLLVSRSINKDYQVVRSFVNNQNAYSRVLWTPRHAQWLMDTLNHPEISGIEAMTSLDWKRFVSLSTLPRRYSESEMLFNFLNQKTTDNLFDQAAIKYIAVPLEDDKNGDNVFMFYGKNREYYINELDKLKYLKKVPLKTSKIALYENTNIKPHFYLTTQKEQLRIRSSFQRVESIFVSPAEYKLYLKDVSKPFYLNFSEAYEPNWLIRVGDFNWYKALNKNNYFLPTSIHQSTDAELNSYYIDPESICKTNSCKKLNNGKKDIILTLYYQPQSYMYLWLIIGGVILSFMSMYLVIIIFRKFTYAKK